jgi:hypothetical protein
MEIEDGDKTSIQSYQAIQYAISSPAVKKSLTSIITINQMTDTVN